MTTFLKNLTLPVVSANLDASKELELDALFTKSTVLKVGGEQIGIVGYTTPETKITSDPGSGFYNDMSTTIQSSLKSAIILVKRDTLFW